MSGNYLESYMSSLLNPGLYISEIEKERPQVLADVSRDGLLLKGKSAHWKADREVVKAAVEQNPFAIRYAPNFQKDREISLLAVNANGLTRFWLDETLQRDPVIREIAERTLNRSFSGREPLQKDENRFFILSSPITQKLIESGVTTITEVPIARATCSEYLRDASIPLLDGKHLIPYAIKESKDKVRERLMVMLPSSATPFIKNNLGRMGLGFLEENSDQAMVMAYDQNIPFETGSTCIEGGNCFIFIFEGERKAVIGEFSIFLSMIALEEQGFFAGHSFENLGDPSEDFVRMARNLAVYHEEKNLRAELENEENIIVEDEEDYQKRLLAPLSPEDWQQYGREAQRLEAKFNLTKECIAKELGVPLKNIAFIPQTRFHIDMELFVTPAGEIILHDDQKVEMFLQNLKKDAGFNSINERLINEYSDSAFNYSYAFKGLKKKQIEVLERHQMKYTSLPAVFEAEGQGSVLNYCNGIFIKNDAENQKKFTFITTGPSHESERLVHQYFTAAFKQLLPSIDLKGVAGMSKDIAEYSGGIHCLTTERFSPFVQQS